MSNGTEHSVLREILSQPQNWQATLEMMRGEKGLLEKLWSRIGQGPVVFSGCGSSWHLSQAIAPVWNNFGVSASAVSATELLGYPSGYWSGKSSGTLFAISRSGKSVETCQASRYARQDLAWHTIAVTCYRESPLTEICEELLVLPHAAENSRFTTRALTSTLLGLELLLALQIRNLELERELAQLPELAGRMLEHYGRQIADFARSESFSDYVYLGQGPYFGLASELSLKTKEMVRTPAEAYPALEYFHGPRHAATPSTLIVVLLSDGGAKYQLELLPKLKPLGAKIAVVCERAVAEVNATADFVFELRSGLSDYARMLLMAPLLQLFVYYRAVAAGRSAWIEEMVYSR